MITGGRYSSGSEKVVSDELVWMAKSASSNEESKIRPEGRR